MSVTPASAGTLTTVVHVNAAERDPQLANNQATATTTVETPPAPLALNLTNGTLAYPLMPDSTLGWGFNATAPVEVSAATVAAADDLRERARGRRV